MQLFGQTFSESLIGRIRDAIVDGTSISRSALSRQVCGWLNWFSPNGRPREVGARKALLELERRGKITLPPARRAPPQLRQDSPPEPWQAPTIAGSLDSLGTMELVSVEGKALSELWRQMMTAYHPLGPGPLCGAQRRYLIKSPNGWLGALAFSAPAWHLAKRDEWIGWCAHARRANLQRIVANSRFLLLPTVQVPNLGSHVLAMAAHRVVEDWPQHYGYAPVLLETFVDETRFTGTVYKAANWQRLERTSGRGRQDTGVPDQDEKAIYVLPLRRNWRSVLRKVPAPTLRRPASEDDHSDETGSWAAREFGGVSLPDGRLRPRLIRLAKAFFDQPMAPISQALQGDPGQTKAAYRFFKNPQVNLQTLLHPHYEQSVARIAAHPRVLVAQDTTNLNFDDHPATCGLGPINTRADGAQGLKLHDSLTLTPDGIPLGLIDIQVWARDPHEAVPAKSRRQRPIEEKESLRWLTSFRRTAEIQRLCPETRLVNIADRESDIYELFQEATREAQGPDILIRANRSTQRKVEAEDEEHRLLWAHLPAQPLAGHLDLHIPGRGGRKARQAELEIRYAEVCLQPPKRMKAEPITLWAVHAFEPNPPADCEAVEWMLLTTVQTLTLKDALERLSWYAARWNIEVYHRTLKSGCRIEDRRLGDANSLEACLAIDLVVAWRIFYLTKLGRKTPEVPCSVFFEEAEWKALYCYVNKTPTPPEAPPPLGDAMRCVAKLGGFLGRKNDGDPGTTTLWRGLDKLFYLTGAFLIFHPALPFGP
jgi:hypothetical protein